MSYESVQRRRLVVAVALTVVLVPALFLVSRDDEPAPTSPPVTVIGAPTTPTTDAADTATGPAATDVMGTSPVDMLNDPLPAAADDPATIAIPLLPHSITGEATFTRAIALATGCYAPEVPFNRRITVTNLDNSRSVDCINNVGGRRPPEAVVLHPDAFLQIADLTDAPVPVQISW